MQIFPSTAASQGPAVDKRAQPLGPEECTNAANDYGRQSANSAGASSYSSGECAHIYYIKTRVVTRPKRINNFGRSARINSHRYDDRAL